MNTIQVSSTTAGLLNQLHSSQQNFCSSYSRTSRSRSLPQPPWLQSKPVNIVPLQSEKCVGLGTALLCFPLWALHFRRMRYFKWTEWISTHGISGINRAVSGRKMSLLLLWEHLERHGEKMKTNTEDLGFSEQLNYPTYWAFDKLSFREIIVSLLSKKQLKPWFE